MFPHDPTSSLVTEAGRKQRVKEGVVEGRAERAQVEIAHNEGRWRSDALSLHKTVREKRRGFREGYRLDPPGFVLGTKAAFRLYSFMLVGISSPAAVAIAWSYNEAGLKLNSKDANRRAE